MPHICRMPLGQMSTRLFGRAASEALDLLFPPLCPVCVTPVSRAHALCAPCWSKIRFIDGPACATCGTPFEFDSGEDFQCAACLASPPPFARARSAMVYDEASKALVLAFKHADRLDLTPALTGWLVRVGGPVLEGADIVVPVPLHWRRLFLRRYNQAAELARGIAARAGIAYAPDLLVRVRPTPSQGTMPSAQARRRNLRGAFRAAPQARAALADRTVVMVDDVFTTGATLAAAARVLRRAGSREVRCLTLARVV